MDRQTHGWTDGFILTLDCRSLRYRYDVCALVAVVPERTVQCYCWLAGHRHLYDLTTYPETSNKYHIMVKTLC